MGLAEFPSLEQVRGWYHSAAYALLKAWRMARGRFTLVLLQVQGLPAGDTLRSTALEAVEQARAQQQRVDTSQGDGSTGSEPVPSPG